jgi:hypothetical protein
MGEHRHPTTHTPRDRDRDTSRRHPRPSTPTVVLSATRTSTADIEGGGVARRATRTAISARCRNQPERTTVTGVAGSSHAGTDRQRQALSTWTAGQAGPRRTRRSATRDSSPQARGDSSARASLDSSPRPAAARRSVHSPPPATPPTTPSTTWLRGKPGERTTRAGRIRSARVDPRRHRQTYLRNGRNPLCRRDRGSVAEGEGFEPSVQGLPTQRFSRPPDSTTLAPLRACEPGG